MRPWPGKLVSLFEPHTEIIRKGKAGKPNEFGKLVQVQEAENQIITHYEVFDERPSDQRLLVAAVKHHQRQLGRVPRLVAADAGFYSRANVGVEYVSVPNRSTRSAERRQLEKRRWFKNGQKWRTGCEGRISVLKRRHGLARCRYHGVEGMRRWVGLGVIADNLINEPEERQAFLDAACGKDTDLRHQIELRRPNSGTATCSLRGWDPNGWAWQ